MTVSARRRCAQAQNLGLNSILKPHRAMTEWLVGGEGAHRHQKQFPRSRKSRRLEACLTDSHTHMHVHSTYVACTCGHTEAIDLLGRRSHADHTRAPVVESTVSPSGRSPRNCHARVQEQSCICLPSAPRTQVEPGRPEARPRAGSAKVCSGGCGVQNACRLFLLCVCLALRRPVPDCLASSSSICKLLACERDMDVHATADILRRTQRLGSLY